MGVYSVPLRWADIDSLRHVNNIRYLQFAEEARLAGGTDVSPASTASFCVDVLFARPMPMSVGRAVVASRIEGGVLEQEIRGADDDRVVYATVTTRGDDLADSLPPVHPGSATSCVPWEIRHGDLARDGRMSTAAFFSLFQEGRMKIVDAATTVHTDQTCVVARSRVDVRRRPSWQSEPFEVHASVGRIGGSSFTIEAVLMNGDDAVARCQTVLVGFDVPTQRSRPLNDRERSTLERYRAAT